MDLKTHLSAMSPEDRDDFARRCDTTKGHLQNVMYGLRACSPELCIAIGKQTNGAIGVWDLRPDDWHRIWPMLIGTEGAPDLATEATEPAPAGEGAPHIEPVKTEPTATSA